LDQQMVVAWGWWPTCSFSVLWCGEAFHGLGVWGAKVLALLVLYLRQVVYSISARSLIHGTHALCICVPVAILDPPH
jgi:hypothetical protein